MKTTVIHKVREHPALFDLKHFCENALMLLKQMAGAWLIKCTLLGLAVFTGER